MPVTAPALPSSNLDAALAYAERGWQVFPLHSMVAGRCSCGADVCSRAKHPRTNDGFKSATTDEQRIRGWWRSWPLANVGIATGSRSGFWVLDIDPDKGGETSLAALVAAHGALPATVEALTGSGGRHLLFRHQGPIPNSTSRLGAGLDVRGDGGYIVAAPSNHERGTVYEWQPDSAPGQRELADAPAWLPELLKPRAAPLLSTSAQPADNAMRRARAYLQRMPQSVQGSNGSGDCIKAAAVLIRGFRLSEAEAFDILINDFNPRCVPAWSEKEVRHKINDAIHKSPLPYGYLLDAEPRTSDRTVSTTTVTSAATPAAAASRVPGEDDDVEVTSPAAPPPLFLPLGDLLDRTIPPAEFLISPWLLQHSFALLVAPPNAGKTLLAFDYALQAAANGKRVFVIEEEGSESGLQLRMRRSFVAAGGAPALRDAVKYRWNAGFSLLDARHVKAITEAVKGADLLVLDSLAALTAGVDENDSKEMSAIAEVLHRLKSDTGATVLVLHHMTKEAWKPGQKPSLASLRGHGALAARADTALALVPLEEAAGVVRFEIHTVKQREAEKATPRTLEVTMTGPAAIITDSEVERTSEQENARLQRSASQVLNAVPYEADGGATRGDVARTAGCRRADVLRVLRALIETRKVVEISGNRIARPGARPVEVVRRSAGDD